MLNNNNGNGNTVDDYLKQNNINANLLNEGIPTPPSSSIDNQAVKLERPLDFDLLTPQSSPLDLVNSSNNSNSTDMMYNNSNHDQNQQQNLDNSLGTSLGLYFPDFNSSVQTQQQQSQSSSSASSIIEREFNQLLQNSNLNNFQNALSTFDIDPVQAHNERVSRRMDEDLLAYERSQLSSQLQQMQLRTNLPINSSNPNYRIAESSQRSIRRKQSAPVELRNYNNNNNNTRNIGGSNLSNLGSIIEDISTNNDIDNSNNGSQQGILRLNSNINQPHHQPYSIKPTFVNNTNYNREETSSCHRNVRSQKLRRQGGPRKASSMPAIRQVSQLQSEERKESPKVEKSPGGISFINFTQEHASTLIAGVAPSGSNKRRKAKPRK